MVQASQRYDHDHPKIIRPLAALVMFGQDCQISGLYDALINQFAENMARKKRFA
jgi:hypothetical protein